jgi:hypothetical protein
MHAPILARHNNPIMDASTVAAVFPFVWAYSLRSAAAMDLYRIRLARNCNQTMQLCSYADTAVVVRVFNMAYLLLLRLGTTPPLLRFDGQSDMLCPNNVWAEKDTNDDIRESRRSIIRLTAIVKS